MKLYKILWAERNNDVLCCKNEEARETNGIAEMFLKCLYLWQKENAFDKVCPMDEARISKKNTYIFFDADFLYMSSELFRKITLPLTKYISITSLKAGLVKDAVLLPEKSLSTFTVKMTCRNEKDEFQRIRMLRLNQEKINYDGKLTFLDLCTLEKEKKNV